MCLKNTEIEQIIIKSKVIRGQEKTSFNIFTTLLFVAWPTDKVFKE